MTNVSRIGTAPALLFNAVIWLLASGGLRAAAPERWVVCYSDKPTSFDLARC